MTALRLRFPRKVARLSLFTPVLLFVQSAYANTEKNQLCNGAGGNVSNNGNGCANNLTQPLTGGIQQITNTLLIVAGAVAVIIIIIAGLRYITSTGDASRIEQSKNTLLYAVIGLIVVIAAYAIVHAVATRI